GVSPLACVIAEDGDAVELRKDEIVAVVPNAVSAGRLYLDARGGFADVGEVALRDRQLLAETGMLVCLCVLDHKSGEVVRGPELLGKGVAGLDDSRMAQARQAALDALAELAPAQRTDHGMVEEALRRAVRSVPEKGIKLRSTTEQRVEAARTVLVEKMAKRGVPLRGLKYGNIEQSGKHVQQTLTFVQGIETEKAKAIVKAIKDSKLKLQGSIQGDAVRVSGKNRDDLQSVIQMARGKQDELKVDLMFENFRD